jgi:hypothetical protein
MKRRLHVTKEQYEALIANSSVECGHFDWMPQYEIVAAICPNGRSVKTQSNYPSNDRVVLSVA